MRVVVNIIKIFTLLTFLMIIGGVSWILYLESYYGNRIYREVRNVPHSEVVLVLGASVQPDKLPSPILVDRLDRAIELYKAGKVDKILLSGDHYNRYYDEVESMKNYILTSNFVRPQDVYLDHYGLRTFDSVYRANHTFKFHSLTIVTQSFHLPRALFLARKIGMESFGFSADNPEKKIETSLMIREAFARILAFFDIWVMHTKPAYTHGPNDLTDGRDSWQR
jgi:SanA protein